MLFTTELEDVIFFRQRGAFISDMMELEEQYGQSDEYGEARTEYLLEAVGSKEDFIARIEDYARHGGVDAMEFVPLRQEDLRKFLEYGTAAHGAQRCEMFEQGAQGWAVHLRDYGRAVNYAENLAIAELGAGAGMGTWAAASQLRPGSCLVSTDFDPMCIRNADAIARHLDLQDRLSGLLANFWRLPFAGEALDTVCAHYALDEAREVPSVLAEVARVLKPGGRFIVTARIHPWDRQRRRMEPFGIAPAECDALLRRARLYCGPEGLAAWAAKAGLAQTQRTDYTPEGSHARTIMVFEKR